MRLRCSMARRYGMCFLVMLSLALPAPGHADFAAPPLPPRYAYPATDRAWSVLDLGTVEAILRQSPPEAYPRLALTQTRDVFLKMVDPGRLASARSGTAPMLHRLIDLRTFDGYLGCYRSRYNIQVLGGAPLQRELVRLQVYQLELSALAIELSGPFIESLEAEERERLKQAGFFAGFGTLRTHLAGTVTSLAETTVYSTADRIELAEAIARTFPRLRRIVPKDERARIAAEVERLAGGASEPALAKALTTLSKVVQTE